jgi:hypothetical protein
MKLVEVSWISPFLYHPISNLDTPPCLKVMIIPFWTNIDTLVYNLLTALIGILAESMGCGKTLISLAMILATRGHMPKIPVEYQTLNPPIRAQTGTLKQMAADFIGRHSVNWKPFFDERTREGQFHENSIKACVKYTGSYIIPPEITKNPSRNSASPYTRELARKLRLCSGTIVIVPQNMVDHWEKEINTHTSGLKVAVLRQSSDRMPTVNELIDFDIVLFSKSRFEQELPAKKHIPLKPGQTALYESPLLGLHWLRVIVDEGHNVASQGTRLTEMLKRLQFERRWVISGTPSPGLYGLEVKLASHEADTNDQEPPEDIANDVLQSQKLMPNAIKTENTDLEKLRDIVITFLDLKPWSNSNKDDHADWRTYIMPMDRNGRRKKAASLRATLQSLVVRHQMNVIEQEVPLPKLYNKVTYLEPTFYDKLSINMFLFTIAVNAIASERQGRDYLFHGGSRKYLNELIENLRQAGFWWAGSTQAADSIDTALKYLAANQEHNMSLPDIERLHQGIHIANTALNSPNWDGFKSLAELGVFVEDFPEDFRGLWAIEKGACNNPLLMGVTQACRAQQFVTKHLRSSDPTEGFSGAGIKARGEIALSKHHSRPGAPDSTNIPATQNQQVGSAKHANKRSARKTFNKKIFRSLPPDSPLKQTRLVGVASAKLRYLLDKVLEFSETEKIIIFYDNQNTAAWVQDGLELINVETRLYASLSVQPQEERTENLNLFRESEEVRVLLMDLRQASHGLHIAQASRVFIINPIWQPNIESQAIKRAHRIGQKRPVYVETLVLKNTLEHRMLDRRKQMSDSELKLAEKSLVADATMSDIIQNEPYQHMEDEAVSGMARLDHPTGFFDRHRLPIPDDEEDQPPGPMKRKKLAALLSHADASSPGSARSSAKRPRIGFAEHTQVLGDGPLNTTQHVPVAPSSQVPITNQSRVGFAEGSLAGELPDRGNGPRVASPILVTSPPVVKREWDNGERRISLFGPYE